MKRLIATVMMLVMLISMSGCASVVGELVDDVLAESKTFSYDDFSITLTEAFSESEYEGYTYCFESLNTAVFALKEEFTLAEGLGDFTIADYADLLFEANSLDESVALKSEDGLELFEFEAELDEGTYHYFAYLFKTDDAFWTVQFAVESDKAEEKHADITAFAKSITF